jgi:hypothetical protein
MSQDSLYSIPGFGKASVRDLNNLGIYKIEELVNKDPESMYAELEKVRKAHVDRCVLYGFREAVYFAEGGRDLEKLKWWNWKDADRSGIKNHKCTYRPRDKK